MVLVQINHARSDMRDVYSDSVYTDKHAEQKTNKRSARGTAAIVARQLNAG